MVFWLTIWTLAFCHLPLVLSWVASGVALLIVTKGFPMYQIGILSKPGRTLTVIRSEVNKGPFFEPRVYTRSLNFVHALKNNKFDAFVVVCDEFKPQNLKVIEQIKHYFPHMPIIIVAEQCSPELKIKITNYKKSIILNALTEAKDIRGILLKMINNFHVLPRLAQRYQTAQSAKIKMSDSKMHTAWVVNLAQDGACFRVFTPTFQKGDKIRIEVPLPQLQKTHILTAEVMWEKLEKMPNEAHARAQKIGVRFLDAV